MVLLLWTFISPDQPCSTPVMKTHFLSEKMFFGCRISQTQGTAVSECFPSKGWAKASAMF